MKIILQNAKTKTENDHPGPNPLQGHTYIPQGFQKKDGESAKKSGHPSDNPLWHEKLSTYPQERKLPPLGFLTLSTYDEI